MPDGFLHLLALLASGAAILQIAARLGLLGRGMEAFAFQNAYLKEAIVLACIFWAGRYYLADM
jgi:hypothetical protein